MATRDYTERAGEFTPRPRTLTDAPLNLPNCGVITLSMIGGLSHAEAWSMLARIERRNTSWKGRTFDTSRRRAYDELGITYERLLGVYGTTLRSFLKVA